MQAHLDQLDLVLGNQIAGLTALKMWLPRKVELLKSHDLNQFEAFSRREEEQVARLQQAESQRQVLTSLIARELELEETPVSLSRLADALGPEAGARLRARGEQLTALAAEIDAGQALVRDMLRLSLDYVHFSLEVFAELANAAPPAAYGDAGAAVAPQGASWLVNHQA